MNFPIKFGTEAKVETYSQKLIDGQRQLLICEDTKAQYLTDGKGGCILLSVGGGEFKTPYITLKEVVTPLKNSTLKGEKFSIKLSCDNQELIKSAYITVSTPGRWGTAEVIIDGDNSYFLFPWSLNTATYEGETVLYTVGWKDTRAMSYEGFENLSFVILK